MAKRSSASGKKTRKRESATSPPAGDSPTHAPESGEPTELGRCRGEFERSGEPMREPITGDEEQEDRTSGRKSRER